MSENIVDNIKENWLPCIPLLIFFIGVIKLIFDKRAVVVNSDNWRTEMLSKVDGEAHNSVNSILKQVFSIDIIIGDKKSEVLFSNWYQQFIVESLCVTANVALLTLTFKLLPVNVAYAVGLSGSAILITWRCTKP